MKVNPLISVIITIYNKGPYLKECLDSVLSQSYKNIEVICIDDGSTDNSVSIVEDFIKKDNRVSLYKSKHNGPSKARNIGIEHCKGDYIHFVDADDLIKPSAYKIIVDLIIIHKNVDLVMFYFHDFTDNVNDLKNVNISQKFINVLNSETPQYFKLISNPYYTIEICGDGANLANKLFNSKIIKKLNLSFDNELVFYEDSDFYYKFAVHSKDVLATPYDFYCYRHHVTGQQTKSKENESKVYESIFKVYYNSLNNYKKNDECYGFYIKSVLNIIFGSYKAINKFDTRYIANKALLNFIETNKKDSYFNEALLAFKNDIKLVKFDYYSFTSNDNFKKKYEEKRKSRENLYNSKIFKIGKIVVYPFKLTKRIFVKIIK